MTREDEVAEDTVDWVPPSATRVARRALVLSAVVCRSGIEKDAGNADAEAFRRNVLKWLEGLGLLEEIEPIEMELLQKPLGALEKQESVNASWRTEGLAVLSWALGKYILPPYDEESDGPAAGEAIGFIQDKRDTVLYDPQLRSLKEFEGLADSLFTLHWRLRQYSLDQKAMDFEGFAGTAWFGPLSLEGIHLLERDLGIRGIPIFRAPAELWRESLSIVQERHQAINWLQGQEPIYSQVTTDT